MIPFGSLYVSVTFMLYLLVIHMFCRFTAKVILTPPAVDKLELSMHYEQLLGQAGECQCSASSFCLPSIYIISGFWIFFFFSCACSSQ